MQPIHITEIPNEINQYVSKIFSIRFPRQGYTSDVGIIESEKGLFAIKRTKEPLCSSWLNKEVSILNSLSIETELPIPKVKKFVMDNHKRQSWALMDFLEGETMRTALSNEKSQEKRKKLIFNFGKVLSRIHSTPCPDNLVNEMPWIDDMLSNAEYNFNSFDVGGTEELLNKIKTNKPNSFNQTLIHGDYTIDNVLVHNGEISGVIDWAGGGYGDPRYDVSLAIRPKPNAFEYEIEKEIFFEGYGGKIIDCKDYDYFVNGLYEFF